MFDVFSMVTIMMLRYISIYSNSHINIISRDHIKGLSNRGLFTFAMQVRYHAFDRYYLLK